MGRGVSPHLSTWPGGGGVGQGWVKYLSEMGAGHLPTWLGVGWSGSPTYLARGGVESGCGGWGRGDPFSCKQKDRQL